MKYIFVLIPYRPSKEKPTSPIVNNSVEVSSNEIPSSISTKVDNQVEELTSRTELPSSSHIEKEKGSSVNRERRHRRTSNHDRDRERNHHRRTSSRDHERDRHRHSSSRDRRHHYSSSYGRHRGYNEKEDYYHRRHYNDRYKSSYRRRYSPPPPPSRNRYDRYRSKNLSKFNILCLFI